MGIAKLKRSAVPGKIPTTYDLEVGEFALNTFDGKLYTKVNDSAGERVVEFGAGGGGGGGLPEAPVDGKLYGRQDADWVEVVAGAGGGGGALEYIGEVVAAGGEAQLTIDIPEGYAEIQGTIAAANETAFAHINVTFNGDGSASYNCSRLYGGTGLNDSVYTNTTSIYSTLSANTALPLNLHQFRLFGHGEADFPTAYTSQGIWAKADYVMLGAGQYQKTDVVSSMQFTCESGTFAAGSKINLWGVKKEAGGGQAAATSGTLLPSSPPLSQDFTKYGHVDGALSDTLSGLVVSMPAVGGTKTVGAAQALPAGDFCFTAMLQPPLQYTANYNAFGIGLRNSANSARLDLFQYNYDTKPRLEVRETPSDASIYGSMPFAKHMEPFPAWLRISRTAGVYSFQISNDGIFWFEVYSTSSLVGAVGTPDQVHAFLYDNGAGEPAKLIIPYWELVTGSAMGSDTGLVVDGVISANAVASQSSWELLDVYEAVGGETSIDISGISQDYQHLRVVGSAGLEGMTGSVVMPITINDDTTASYRWARHYGGQVHNDDLTQGNSFEDIWTGSHVANRDSVIDLTFYNYTGGRWKSFIATSAPWNESTYVITSGGEWQSTDPVEKLTFATGAGSFIAGSRIEVWGQSVAGGAGGGSVASAARPVPYSVPMGFAATPTASEVLLIHTFAEAVRFNSNWAGSKIYVGTNPAGNFSLSVTNQAGDLLGNILVSAGGSVTFSTLNGGTVSFAAGDTIIITAPALVDTTITNVAVTLKGSRI